MGCICCALGSFVSTVLDALERISLCTVCAMLTCCLLLTIVTVMGLGIGIGYHYCMVQSSVSTMEQAENTMGASRRAAGGVPELRSVDKSINKQIAHRLSRREISANQTVPENNSLDLRKNITDFSKVINIINKTKKIII